MSRAVPAWIVLGAFATVLAGVLYAGRQQQLRGDANHPQVEMARAAASRLDAGATPESVLPGGQVVDIGRSPDSYLIVVDTAGAVLATSAELGGALVIPPAGVFDYVRTHGEDVISWQPEAGVRSAIVVDAFDGGYVVAGRSLKATEDAEDRLGILALAGWALAMTAAGGLGLLRARLAG
jgi:hypothetical protein